MFMVGLVPGSQWSQPRLRHLSVAAALTALMASLLLAIPSPAQASTCPTVDPLSGAVTPDGSTGTVSWSGCNLAGANLQGADLTSGDLGSANLTGANLRYATLASTNLTGANLTDAMVASSNLLGATLDSAVFDNANLFGANLAGASVASADMGDAILRGMRSGSLAGTPFSLPAAWQLVNGYLVGPGVNLQDADLSGADLSGADLSFYSFLYGANLTGANLTGVNLFGATLDYANLTGANLTSANLSGTHVSGPTLTDANLTEANLSNASMQGVDFTDVNLTGATLIEAGLFGATLTGANLTGANLTFAVLTSSNMTEALLPNATMVSANLVSANLTSANLTSANLTSANLTAATLTNANLTGANLSTASGCYLIGADAATLPTGSGIIDDCLASVPAAPAPVSVVGTTSSATVSWGAPASPVTPITGFQVTVNPGGRIVTAGSTATSSVVTGLSPGVTYTFSVNALNAIGSGPASAATNALGTTLTAKASVTSVTYGYSSTLSGVLKTISGSPLSGRSVRILGKQAGATIYSTVGTATTNATGYYALAVKPSKGTYYYASHAGGAGLMGRSTSSFPVSVKPSVSFALNDSTATRTQTVYFSGTVYPNARYQTVYLQRYASGKWSSVKSMKLSSTSWFKFAWKPTSSADYSFRVYVPSRTGYLAAYTSSRKLTVA